jgi:hypothetical protein
MNEAQLISLKERVVCLSGDAIGDLAVLLERAGVEPFTTDERDFILDAVNEKANALDLVSPDGAEPGRIDPQAAIAISHGFLRTIRAHYKGNTVSRDRVLEVLNALAFTLEAVLSATDHDEKALAFFDKARELNRKTGQ